MFAIVSCAVALAGHVHSHEPEQAPAQSPQASTNPPQARPDSKATKPDPSDSEESTRRIRTRGDTGTSPAARHPMQMPKVIRWDRNSFHPPTNHGEADPSIPMDARTRHE